MRRLSRSWGKVRAGLAVCKALQNSVGRYPHDTPEDLREMARTRVADIERDLDQAARRLKARPLLRSGYGANELLGARDSLTCDELNASWPSPA